MKIGIVSDHRGFEMKQNLTKCLKDMGYNIVDYGTNSKERVDYTKYGFLIGDKVASNEVDYGIAICGSAIGVTVACNKVKGIRCGKLNNVKEAIHAKECDFLNIIALSGENMTVEDNLEIVNAFFNAENNMTDPAYKNRVQQIMEYEND